MIQNFSECRPLLEEVIVSESAASQHASKLMK